MTIALMAAFADGLKDERERAAVKQVADALGSQGGVDLPALYRDALIAKPDLGTAGLDAAHAASRGSSPTRWQSACATPTEHTGGGEGISQRGSPRALDLPVAVTGDLDRRADEMAQAASDDGATAAAAPAIGHGPRQVESVGGRARPDDPQGCDHQRRARAAARGSVLDGDHSAADAAGVPHRQGLRIRARQRATRRISSRRSASVSPRSISSSSAASCWADCSGRSAAASAGRSAVRPPAPDSRSRRPTRSAASRSATTRAVGSWTRLTLEGDVHRDAGRGARPGAAIPRRDRAARQVDQPARARLADPRDGDDAGIAGAS